MNTPEEIVQRQLDYYNENNLEAFISTYHVDVEILNLEDNVLVLKGLDALREKYRERFEIQKVKAELANRIVIGDKVIDHERVSGIKSGEIVKAVAVYKVEGTKIKRVWFLYE